MKNVVDNEVKFLQENLVEANLLYEGKGKKLYKTALNAVKSSLKSTNKTSFNAVLYSFFPLPS